MNRRIYAKLSDHMKAICLPVAQFSSDQWLSQMLGISFEGGSVPSSAMPSKRNPGGSENMMGVYLLLESLGGAYRNAITNFERHLSDSAYNRLFVPLVCQLGGYILARGRDIVDDLDISLAAIKRDFDAGRGMMAGEAVKYELVALGKTTVEAHNLLKGAYKNNWDALKDGIGGIPREEVNRIAANIEDYIGISPYVVKTQLNELDSRIKALSK
jgi:adenylosuccinate lyase